MRDAQLLQQANLNARLVLLPDMNHVLKTVTSDGRHANITAYADPDIVPAIAAFVKLG